MFVYVCVCVCVCVALCACLCTYIHTYTYAYIIGVSARAHTHVTNMADRWRHDFNVCVDVRSVVYFKKIDAIQLWSVMAGLA
jgi:hypothetical protein